MSEPEQQDDESPIEPGMAEEEALTPALSRSRERGKRKVPRWVVPFLCALARTGEARASAVDAGIDHTTAYARRKAHADFAADWAEALRAHAAAKARAEAEEIAAVRAGGVSLGAPSTIASSGNGPPPRPGEELVVSGGQVKRAGHDRWSARKEKIFFEELAATANIKRSAAAAGVSYNAVLARRQKHPLFRAKWEAVVQYAKATIDLYLVEETKKTFDPETLDTGEVQPKVTIDQAIKISQSGAAKAKPQEELLPDPFAEQAASMSERAVHELRESIIRKLRRYRDREMPKWIEEGWSYDEAYDHMVPPGWVRAAGGQASKEEPSRE